MKKRGFTLIELLGVLILLAVIAFIAYRSVDKILDNASKNSKKISEQHYLKYASDAIALDMSIKDGKYSIMSNGNICIGTLSNNNCKGNVLDLSVSGDYPISGSVTVRSRKIVSHYFVYADGSDNVDVATTFTGEITDEVVSKFMDVSALATGNLTNAGFAYKILSFENKTITRIDIPVKTVSALDGNQTFTVMIIDKATKEIGKVATIKKTITLKLPESALKKYSSTTINDWISITDLDIEVGSGEDLAFGSKNDTVTWGYSSNGTIHTFLNKVNGTNAQTGPVPGALLFSVYGQYQYTEEEIQFNSNLQELNHLLSGKYFSILGDSISTYEGISNDNKTSNSTIGSNLARYNDLAVAPSGIVGFHSYHDTWWQQAADDTGMITLVNNSWRGTKVYGTGNSVGYLTRATQLHANLGVNAGKDPDVIAIYMATNDFLQNVTVGSFSKEMVSDLITDNGNGTYTYKTASNFAEAYTIMLHKIIHRYSTADIFCLTMSPVSSKKNDTLLEQYNAQIRLIVDYFNVSLVDLYKDSGIVLSNCDDYLAADNIHPTEEGMDLLTKTLEQAMIDKYIK